MNNINYTYVVRIAKSQWHITERSPYLSVVRQAAIRLITDLYKAGEITEEQRDQQLKQMRAHINEVIERNELIRKSKPVSGLHLSYAGLSPAKALEQVGGPSQAGDDEPEAGSFLSCLCFIRYWIGDCDTGCSSPTSDT